MSATEEGYNTSSEFVSAIVQLTPSKECTIGIQDAEDASEDRALELEVPGHAKNDEADVDVATGSIVDEESRRESLGDVSGVSFFRDSI